MTTLSADLAQMNERLDVVAPAAVAQTIRKIRDDFIEEFNPENAIQIGEKLPPFRLPNANGVEVSGTDLLAHGPLVITFYRGEWCPFCNLALRALQGRLEEIKARGANLVAISPELPDASLTTIEKNELQFPVLSDVGVEFARKLGIVWNMPDTIRPVFKSFEHDLQTRNGDDSFRVPVPVTLLVDRNGIVRNVYVEADYTKRIEPQEVIDWLDKL